MKKIWSLDRKNVTYNVGLLAIMYIIAQYILGIKLGFSVSENMLSIKTIFKVILPISIFIVVTEYVREKILTLNFKYKKTLAFFIMLILDIIVSNGKYDITSSSGFLAFIRICSICIDC